MWNRLQDKQLLSFKLQQIISNSWMLSWINFHFEMFPILINKMRFYWSIFLSRLVTLEAWNGPWGRRVAEVGRPTFGGREASFTPSNVCWEATFGERHSFQPSGRSKSQSNLWWDPDKIGKLPGPKYSCSCFVWFFGQYLFLNFEYTIQYHPLCWWTNACWQRFWGHKMLLKQSLSMQNFAKNNPCQGLTKSIEGAAQVIGAWCHICWLNLSYWPTLIDWCQHNHVLPQRKYSHKFLFCLILSKVKQT